MNLQLATLLIERNQVKVVGRGRSWLKIAVRTPDYMALRRPGRSLMANGRRKYHRAALEFWKLTPGPEGTWLGERLLEVPLR